MRTKILLVLITMIFYSCQNNVEQTLTAYTWKTEKVVGLKNGSSKESETGQDKVWDFSENNTYQHKTINGNSANLDEGKWHLSGLTLQLINEFDSTIVIIEEINEERMVWLVNQNDSVKFFLSSQVKKPTVPNFPSGSNE